MDKQVKFFSSPSKFSAECRDTDRYPRDQHEECPCSTHENQLVGEWSDCILSENPETGTRFAQMSLTSIRYRLEHLNMTGSSATGTRAECGNGKRFMALRCANPQKDALGNTRCLGEQYREENCSIPCPVDCQMSDWTDWSPCSVQCGSGISYRSRKVVTQQANGGRLCPFTPGKTKEAEPVTEPLVVSCEEPCDNDCLMTAWTPWTHCTTSCGLGTTRRRRSILKHRVGLGRQCPLKLEQTKPCFNKGCYVWSVSGWSSCSTQLGICGVGVQERNVSCLDEQGRPVNSSKCTLDPAKLVMPTRRSCKIPCPGECKLSEWTTWTRCHIGCEDFRQGLTSGVRARSRAILSHPSPGNPPCDTALWQQEPCYAVQCAWFEWHATRWNIMTKHRRVVCRRNDGLEVTG
ncbi:thrombospondin type-1 domain-containing protein 7B [Elysia marginata]|uniref:Thrombospondin type-1 domain-containing protein 7B n=1 Tax=Elysia marginata TaxID=1093978 RepID=A0AAV4FUL1_9GAST|nr:thrombospondin type-1 domain-containing protein 7B [Elysia marginata]